MSNLKAFLHVMYMAIPVLAVVYLIALAVGAGIHNAQEADKCHRHGGAYVKSVSPAGYTCIGENK